MSGAHFEAPRKRSRPRFEVADVFELYGAKYRLQHRLSLAQLKVMRAIENCRTKTLGGHLEACSSCGFSRPAYNSCRNRHCPKCQALAKARWLEARKRELLPVSYFHLVFTLPHELNRLAWCNKKIVYDLLFQAVAQTLATFARDPKRGLGGKIGFTAILHTWDQKLGDHLHLHCAVPAGALSCDSQRWMRARENFLFPVKALGKMFRGKFIHGLKEAYEQRKLIFPGQSAPLAEKKHFSALLQSLYDKPWVVYAKPAFGGPQSVLDYLGRYTHRVAVSNHRIKDIKDQLVTFTYRDRRDGDQKKEMTLEAHEFIRRFLLHVVPKAFMRIRHFGFLANKCKQKDLSRCRALLKVSATESSQQKTTPDLVRELIGREANQCPKCQKGCMHMIEIYLPSYRRIDTS